MLKGIHFLLSYTCNMTCDHCFLYCSPAAGGTMTFNQISTVLDEAKALGTVTETFWEGGEPFLFYPLLLAGIEAARTHGFSAGIVTNGYWATSVADARLWLEPLAELGLANMGVSDDELHFGPQSENPAKCALAAARQLNLAAYPLSKEKPEVVQSSPQDQDRGTPEISGGIKMRGRAVETFAHTLPTRKREDLSECPYEELRHPKRVHLDAYGTVQICQGISLGNCWETPLSQLIEEYDADKHPICSPLLRGGPLALAAEYDLDLEPEYVDECHLCYCARLALLDRFPEYLAPRQVYGK